MPTSMVHVTFIGDLGREDEVEPSLRSFIQQYPEYARLGALLPDLQYYEHFYYLSLRYIMKLPLPFRSWSYLFHSRAPGTLGRALIEVLRKEPFKEQLGAKLALIAGYFSHLALDRTLHPLVQRSAQAEGRNQADARSVHATYERYQSLFFHQELYGVDITGTPICRRQIRILPPGYRSLDGILYFFLKKTCLEAFARSPRKRQFDNWIRSLHLYARFVSSSLGRYQGLRGNLPLLRKKYYENEDFSFPGQYRRAKGLAIHYLNLAHHYWEQEELSEESRRRFLGQITNVDLSYPLTNRAWDKVFFPSKG